MTEQAKNLSGEWTQFNRFIPVEMADGDGRTLVARIVPYNVVARVADPPLWESYQEMFMPGAFRAQLTAADRIKVLLNYEHGQSIGDVIGHGTSLEDHSDGLYGTFRVLNHPDGDKALELVREGVLRGLSAEFRARRSRIADGVTQRMDARIGKVALCHDYGAAYAGPKAAYAGAEVLAVRQSEEGHEHEGEEEQQPVVVPSLLPPSFDRLARFGIEAPAWSVRKDK